MVPSTLISGNYMPIYNSSEPLRIGVSKVLNSTLSGYFLGEIDELRLWNYKLSVTEILSRMNTALTGNEPGLVAYYDMEETGSGNGFSIINKCNATGNALNGTTIGNADYPRHITRCTYAGIVPPVNLTTTNITSQSAKCNWSAVSGATKYQFRYRKDSIPTLPWITSTVFTGTTKTLSGLSKNTKYKWSVKSYVSGKWSAWATTKSFKTKATPRYGLDENEEQNISIYPNPNNGNFTIDFGNEPDQQKHSIIIRNVLSQIIFETKTNDERVEINLSGVAQKGIYFLEIKDKNMNVIYTRKVIITGNY